MYIHTYVYVYVCCRGGGCGEQHIVPLERAEQHDQRSLSAGGWRLPGLLTNLNLVFNLPTICSEPIWWLTEVIKAATARFNSRLSCFSSIPFITGNMRRGLTYFWFVTLCNIIKHCLLVHFKNLELWDRSWVIRWLCHALISLYIATQWF